MATRFEILMYGAERHRLEAAGEGALDEVERLESRLSLFRSASEISHINAQAHGRSVKVEPSLFRLLQRARDIWELTGGAFDPSIGPLARAWGLRGGDAAAVDAQALDEARERVGMQHVTLDQESYTIRLDRPGMSLDLGAMGKGYAVEAAAHYLRECGVESALVHGGTSSVCAIGSPPGEEGWLVEVQDPRVPERKLAQARLRDNSLSVSALHGRQVQVEGRVVSHVLDPRSGQPVEGALTAAVVCDSPADGDALSTALLVLGQEGLGLLEQRLPETSALAAIPDGGSVRTLRSGSAWLEDRHAAQPEL